MPRDASTATRIVDGNKLERDDEDDDDDEPLLLLLLLAAAAGAAIELCAAAPQRACIDPTTALLPFCNVSLPIEQRVQDLVGRMKLEEKISQIVSNSSSLPRLGIPAYQWWEEALHGVSDEGPGVHFSQPIPAATSYPQVILTAASFNVTLWNEIAQAISVEARAMYNAGESGLTFWSPNLNIFRDPRWGRGQETPGEDPVLSGKYAAYFVRGLQEGYYSEGMPEAAPVADSKLKVSSCCKHFTAYDMEKSGGTDAFHFNAEVTLQDLEDTFNPPFKSCVEQGRASGVMCSYNRVNGVPSCADRNLLTETVRKSWGFQGYIVSDCDAVALLYEYINYTKTGEEAAADVLEAGMDLNCGTFLLRHTNQAIQKGMVTESMVNKALSSVLTIRMRLGLFDGNTGQEYDSLGPSDVCTQKHQALSVEAAEQGIVLLKNEGGVLPLSRGTTLSLAVIGPNGNATKTMLGNYAGIPCNFITPFNGLREFSNSFIEFKPGCADVACYDNAFLDSAIDASRRADAVIVVVGLDQDQEREGRDRTSLLLPGRQHELVSMVRDAAKGPVILIVMSGGPVDISFAKEDIKIPSILWVGYPGESGGRAIARVIFGDYNPAGKLPMTWYPEEFTRVSMLDMNMRPNISRGFPGRTYRFYTGEAVFSFGHGLSYTNFSTTIVSAPSLIRVWTSAYSQKIRTLTGPTIRTLPDKGQGPAVRTSSPDTDGSCFLDDVDCCKCLDFDVVVAVHNVGKRDGDHVVLLFTSPPASSSSGSNPKEKLVAFKRVHLRAGDSTEVKLSSINVCKDFSLANEAGKRVLPTGIHTLQAYGAATRHEISVLLV